MIDALFDNKIERQFDKIKEARAKLNKKEDKVLEQALRSVSANTIRQVLDVVKDVGKPNEQRISQSLRDKFETDKLELDDLMTLNSLYKSNWRQFKNKGGQNE